MVFMASLSYLTYDEFLELEVQFSWTNSLFDVSFYKHMHFVILKLHIFFNDLGFVDHVLKIENVFLFQTPFNFGVNHRTPPYPAGDYCLLCRSERKDSSFLESGIKTASKLALSVAPKGNNVLHLPLWVCPDCRRTVEKEERHGGLDQPAVSTLPSSHPPWLP